MTEYIERDALLDNISAAVKHRGMGEIIGKTLMRYVKRQPAADVAPVVRCKDCKHYLIADEFDGGKRIMCEVNHFSYLNSDGDMHFCSYGERRGKP